MFEISLACWHAAFRTFLCVARASMSTRNPGITPQITFQPYSSRFVLSLTEHTIEQRNMIFDLLSGECLRLNIAVIIRGFIFDPKVYNRVNRIEGT